MPKAQAQIPSTPRGLELKGPFGHESPVVCMLRKRFTQFMICVQCECDEKCVKSEDIRSHLNYFVSTKSSVYIIVQVQRLQKH